MWLELTVRVATRHRSRASLAGSLVLALGLTALGGCVDSETVTCSWGAVCPLGMVCAEEAELCVLPSQITACAGSEPGDDCSYAGSNAGRCVDGICVGFDCGDGILTAPEECDGVDLGDVDCVSLGYYRGNLTCTEECKFDTSGCAERCGDGVINGDEECDELDFGGETCLTLGYSDGSPLCQPDCSLDLTECYGVCGDGFRTPDESCDGSDVGGKDCVDLGLDGGQLGCGSSCEFSVEHCWLCGDGFCNGADEYFLCPQDCTYAVGAGDGFSCAARGDGVAWCWGHNSFFGRLGDGTTIDHPTPELVSSLQNVAVISTGSNHACAARSDGTAVCWGQNKDGQVGDGTLDNSRLSPVAVVGLTNVVGISANGGHTCAVGASGEIWCWGTNGDGQLGNGTTSAAPTPQPIGSLTSMTAVSAGLHHTCALDSGGAVWCWGLNDTGQLGNGTLASSTTPVPVSGVQGVSAIAAGADSTCALTTGGDVWCWGGNQYGQLGNGSLVDSPTPVQVSGLANVTNITVGWEFACAVTLSGNVLCWGRNTYGQIGAGVHGGVYQTPIHVLIPSFYGAVSAGREHVCAVGMDEVVWCWGQGEQGELGDGAAHTDCGSGQDCSPVPIQADFP